MAASLLVGIIPRHRHDLLRRRNPLATRFLGGGAAVIQHYALRLALWRAGKLPRDYIGFLDYAAQRLLLRKVGGGYIFVHRTLLEYFADRELEM